MALCFIRTQQANQTCEEFLRGRFTLFTANVKLRHLKRGFSLSLMYGEKSFIRGTVTETADCDEATYIVIENGSVRYFKSIGK